MPENHGAKRFMDLLCSAMQKLGRPAYVTGESLKENLEKAGFVDVKVLGYKQPFGPWPKEKRLKHVGAMAIMSAETGYHSYGMQLFTRVLGMSTEEAEKACRDAIAATKNKNYHVYNYL